MLVISNRKSFPATHSACRCAASCTDGCILGFFDMSMTLTLQVANARYLLVRPAHALNAFNKQRVCMMLDMMLEQDLIALLQVNDMHTPLLLRDCQAARKGPVACEWGCE